MKINYDVLKCFGQVILPAIITCTNTIMIALGVENADLVNTILLALLTCYNSVIVIWNADYYKQQANALEQPYTGEI